MTTFDAYTCHRPYKESCRLPSKQQLAHDVAQERVTGHSMHPTEVRRRTRQQCCCSAPQPSWLCHRQSWYIQSKRSGVVLRYNIRIQYTSPRRDMGMHSCPSVQPTRHPSLHTKESSSCCSRCRRSHTNTTAVIAMPRSIAYLAAAAALQPSSNNLKLWAAAYACAGQHQSAQALGACRMHMPCGHTTCHVGNTAGHLLRIPTRRLNSSKI